MPDGLALGFTLVPPNELAGPLGLVLLKKEVPALKHLKHLTFIRGWIFVWLKHGENQQQILKSPSISVGEDPHEVSDTLPESWTAGRQFEAKMRTYLLQSLCKDSGCLGFIPLVE